MIRLSDQRNLPVRKRPTINFFLTGDNFPNLIPPFRVTKPHTKLYQKNFDSREPKTKIS